MSMRIGIIGLGAMGSRIAQRLQKQGFSVIGYDIQCSPDLTVPCVISLAELRDCAIIWCMIPHAALDTIIDQLIALNITGTLVDGGNSYYQDSIQRAKKCADAGIKFLDCGVSGGIIAEQGYCLMVGGEHAVYLAAEPIFKALAAPGALLYTGISGSGHYVKMIHNGIEYGLLQAYAEGFAVLEKSPFMLDLLGIAHAWGHGALIQSQLLGVFADALSKPDLLGKASGIVPETGMGEWAAREGEKLQVPTPVLQGARAARVASQNSAQGRNFASKLIATVRTIFGGHQLF